MNDSAVAYYRAKREAQKDAADRVVTGLACIEEVKHIHFTGICGKAMASLAGLCVQAGYTVTGSDQSWEPPMNTVLEHLGIHFNPLSEDNIKHADVVVMGNVFDSTNPEARYARDHVIPQISVAQAFADLFIQNRVSIVVGGTHGKTTTTGMMAQVFLNSGASAHVLVGGVMKNTDESYAYGGANAQYSIIEGDEYDSAYFDKSPKLLNYKPTIGIITSIEFDHADIYSDFSDYLNAFIFFAQEIPVDGILFVSDDVAVEHRNILASACKGRILVYGFSSHCDIVGANIRVTPQGSLFDMIAFGETYTDILVPMYGEYNVLNALAVVATALSQGLSMDAVRASLAAFRGMKQRQEVLFDSPQVTVIDDFAHHPTAVLETLAGIRLHYPDRRIVAVFEPRSVTSRRKDFEIPYAQSFDSSDIVYISTPPFKSVDSKDNFFDPQYVISLIQKTGKRAQFFDDKDKLFQAITNDILPGDVIVIMSNGHFDGLRERVVAYCEGK